MASSSMNLQVNCSVQKPHAPIFHNFGQLKAFLSSTFKPFLEESSHVPMQIKISSRIKETCANLVDEFVDSVFEFVDLPLLPAQKNFAPVNELGKAIVVNNIEGNIPDGFPEGVYIRNGPNPLFGGLKSARSVFGRSSHTWIEGEGMLHAVYFKKDSDGRWNVQYNNRYVETDTFKLEKQKNKPSFIPAIQGDSPAVLSAYLFNMLRLGKVNKFISNTNVFEHCGKFYSIAENHMPHEIDISGLKTIGNWNLNGDWKRPFTSHPKKAPDSGELVIIGVNPIKPYMELGIISADGKKLVHKVDLNLDRCSICHDVGVTWRYNVIMDFPLTIDLIRLARGGPLIQFDENEYARIGVMPRYGDARTMKWFRVESNCTFHILNCFEDGDEVVMLGCRALESIIPGPDLGSNKFDWFSERLMPMSSSEENPVSSSGNNSLFSNAYEWRLNMKTGEVKERRLTGNRYSMDFPVINPKFTGIRNKYGYTQVVDILASSDSCMVKYGGLAKLHFEEPKQRFSSKKNQIEDAIRVEYHMFEENIFCSSAAFIPREGGTEEDDGWIISYVHDECNDVSQVYMIDTQKFSDEPIAKITLPYRVPYGFHGAFICQTIH